MSAAVIVDDRPNTPVKTAKELGNKLEEIMADEEKLKKMAVASRGVVKLDAVNAIALKING